MYYQPWIADLVLAGMITVLSAWIGFNSPSWSRTYTTAALYRLAVVGHAAFYLLVLLLVYATLRRIYVGGPQSGAAEAELSSTLVWSALCLTLCIRAVPIMSSRPRAWLRRIARIPGHAHRVAKKFYEAEVEFAPSVYEEARAMLLTRGIDLGQEWLPLALPVNRLLLKATAAFIQVRRWENDRRYARFLREAQNDFDVLRQRFDQLSFRVSRTLASIERLGAVRNVFPANRDETPATSEKLDVLLRKIVSDLIADTCEEISSFYNDACLLAARGVLTTRPTRKGRHALTRSLGFMVENRDSHTGYGILAYAAVLLYIGIGLFFLILPAPPTEMGRRTLVVLVTVIVFGSFAIAIVPKLHWGFANAGLRAKTPVRFVVGAAVCATLFSLLVNVVAGAVIYGGGAGVLTRLYEAGPYLLSSAATAATMAWLVQDHRWGTVESPRVRRLFDGATLALVWMMSTVVSRILLVYVFPPSASSDPSSVTSLASHVPVVFGALVLGSVIGCAIPELVRVDELRAMYRKEAEASSRMPSAAMRQPAI